MRLFDEKTRKALRNKVKKDLEPMHQAMFEYHLKRLKGGEKMSKIEELKIWLKETVKPYEPTDFIFDV